MKGYTLTDWLKDLADVPLGGWLFWGLMVFLLIVGS